MAAKIFGIIALSFIAIGILGSIAYSIYAAVMEKKGKPYLKCWFPLFETAEGYVYPKKMKEPEPFFVKRYNEWCIDASVAKTSNIYWGKTKEEALKYYYEHEAQRSIDNVNFGGYFTDSL